MKGEDSGLGKRIDYRELRGFPFLQALFNIWMFKQSKSFSVVFDENSTFFATPYVMSIYIPTDIHIPSFVINSNVVVM